MSAPDRRARVIATLYSAVRHPKGTANYFTTCMVEYVVIVGAAYRSAKYPVEIIGARSEQEYRDQVKDALVLELNERWPADVFTARDIMLFGL
jgi:hypothetical protein